MTEAGKNYRGAANLGCSRLSGGPCTTARLPASASAASSRYVERASGLPCPLSSGHSCTARSGLLERQNRRAAQRNKDLVAQAFLPVFRMTNSSLTKQVLSSWSGRQ